jgi:hypothetical protein
MAQQLFKYVTADTAKKILQNRTLRWGAPESFNDPFEFKSPFEFGFEWEDLENPLLDEMTRLVTQPEQPELIEEGPTTGQIRNARIAYAAWGHTPSDVRRSYEGAVAAMIDQLRRSDNDYDQLWRRMKREWRVLCLSAVANNILMWSHYAERHKGAVLAFQSRVESRSELTAAKAVSYSKQVNTAASLAEFVAFLTSQRPKPNNEEALERSVFVKSIDWAYEEEWRVLTKDTSTGTDPFSYRPFDPTELVAIYFGCRTRQQTKDEIIAAAKGLEIPISFFKMRDERIRFELAPVPIEA